MPGPETNPPRDEIASLTEGELRALAKDAFFWGMHPVAMYELRYALTQWKAGPDRYFGIQALDQYPNWFMAVGNQFTGQAAQESLIVGPDFRGPYPSGFAAAQMYEAPSNCVLVAARFALKSTEPEEIATVNSLMDQTTIAPVSVWEANGRRPVRAEDQPVVEPSYATIPRMTDPVAIADNLTGVDLLQMVSLVLNDPTMTLRQDSAKEIATLGRIARLGLAPGVAFDPAWLSSTQAREVEAAFGEAKQDSTRRFEASRFTKNGWSYWIGLTEDISDYVKQAYYGLWMIAAPVPTRSHSGAFGSVDTDGEPFVGASKLSTPSPSTWTTCRRSPSSGSCRSTTRAAISSTTRSTATRSTATCSSAATCTSPTASW